ncbi:reverse transcriptase domain-containing protein [Tanacetum coccineum]
MPTWCHMFNSTLIGSARLWFDELPPESIDSYVELWKAFLVYFLQQKKYIKDPVEIHHIKQREWESTEAFMEHFKAKSMHVKGAPECMRVSGFMHEITNLDLIKPLNDNIPKSVDDMMNMTTTFLRGKVAVANQSRKKGPLSWRHHEAPWKRVTGQNVTQIFSTNPEISFLLIENDDGQESPMVIEVEIGGHLIHRMYVDGGDEEHSTSARMNFMVVRSPSSYNGFIGRLGIQKIQAVPSTAHGMIKFQWTSKWDPTNESTTEKGINMAIYPEYLEHTITIGRGLSEKGKMELCNLLKNNLGVFAWKPADMTRVPGSIVEHRLNIHEGCPQ